MKIEPSGEWNCAWLVHGEKGGRPNCTYLCGCSGIDEIYIHTIFTVGCVCNTEVYVCNMYVWIRDMAKKDELRNIFAGIFSRTHYIPNYGGVSLLTVPLTGYCTISDYYKQNSATMLSPNVI